MTLTQRLPVRRTIGSAIGALLSVIAIHTLGAQGQTAQRDRAAASSAALEQARKLLAAGDSGQAARILRTASAADPDNGPLWYEYGALLSAQSRHAWRKGIMPPGAPQMITAAESSLARAVRLSPDSVNYAIAYGKHLWGTNTTSIARATSTQKNALEKLTDGGDSISLAQAADNLGVMMWRRFEPLIGRGTPLTISGEPNFLNRTSIVQYVKENYRRPTVMYGIALIDEALSYFSQARIADPDNELYLRHEAMVLAELNRWDEVAALARARTRERPRQAWPWLTLGLASYRTNRLADARAAFDSGFARLPAADRNRLASIARLMPHRREGWYDSLATPAKEQLHQLYWNTANPSMLLPSNPMHDEFRARVVYAELRFTDDEKPINGASSQKGEVYIRYGPPEIVMPSVLIPRHAENYDLLQSWIYVNELMIFTFGQNKLYGTSYHTAGSRTDFDSSKIDRPVAWTNLPILRNRIDSVSAQVARFRGSGDSIDVAIFAGFRTGALRRNTETDSSTIRHGVFFVDALGREITRSTGAMTSGERDTSAMLGHNYFVRTTASASAVRVEALEPDLMQAARSINDLTGFTTSGFGISDLLIASNVELPAAAGTKARWSDYRMTSLTGGIVKRGSPLALLWESYEAGIANGAGRLRVTVNVQRETDKGLVALSGRVVGGLREALGGARGNNRVGIGYDREFAATPVLVDHLVIDVGRLDPGRYRVTLTVTDVVRKMTVNRLQRFRIVP